MNDGRVLTVRGVSIEYEVDPPVKAVRDVSLTLGRGEILGLAGESGCGKTTLAYGINRLLKAPAIMTAGEVVFHDRSGEDIDIVGLRDDELRAFRWSKVSMVRAWSSFSYQRLSARTFSGGPVSTASRSG